MAATGTAHQPDGSVRMTGSVVAFALVLLAVVAASLLGPARAGADQPFRVAFDRNEIRIGSVGSLPLDEVSAGALIEGTVDPQGRVTIPKGKFTLPILGIDDPVKLRGFMGIEEAATGTWDPKTGRLEIQAKAGLWLSIDVAGVVEALQASGVDLGDLGALAPLIRSLGDLTCGFSPMDVTFTTETTSQGSGQRFTQGLAGPGALTTEWSQLGPFAGKTRVLGFLPACELIRSALPGLISGALGGVLPPELGLGNLDIASLLENLDNLDLGPSSLTIARTVDESEPSDPPDPASLTMSMRRGPVKVRAGRRARIPVRVTNSGELPATGVKACPRLPKSSRTSGSCIRMGTLQPGEDVSRTVVVRAKRSAETGSGKTAKGRTRTVRLSIVVTGTGLPAETRGLVLKVVG